jgi:hypothetical protein
MPVTGVDIAWARPSVAQIKGVGAHWVARYLSADTSKNITAAEVRDYRAAGLGTVVVWETSAGRATAGYAAGQADARAAEVERKAVGLPADMPIHLAVDEDTSWSSVAPYFSGAASVIGQARVGVYGGFKVIEGAAAARYHYLWQTVAWSGGRWSGHATIRQSGGTTLAGGADWDQAETPDFGQYPRPVAPPKPPPPVTAPTFLEEDVITYLPPIPANATVDIPVEPAGTAAHPQGAVRNGPLYLAFAPQGGTAVVDVTWHGPKGWQTPARHTLTPDGAKYVSALPADGSVDKVRVHTTGPLLGYLSGRQV